MATGFPYTFPVTFTSSTSSVGGNAGAIVNDTALELGLNGVPDPFLSNDSNFRQLVGLLKSIGRELWRTRPWTFQVKEYVFTTVAGQQSYPFPVDFGALVNQSGWDRTNQIPVGGPLNSQDWQALKAKQPQLAFIVAIRQWQNALQIFQTVAAGRVIAYEYVSKFWVSSAAAVTAGTGADQDAAVASSDTINFDPLLMVKALRLEWRKAKGFDTSADQADYERVLALVMGDDSAMPILSLQGSNYSEPLVSLGNLPITGYG